MFYCRANNKYTGEDFYGFKSVYLIILADMRMKYVGG